MAQSNLLFVDGVIETYRQEEPNLDEFVDLLREVIERLQWPVACLASAETGIGLGEPTATERVIPVGRFLSLALVAAPAHITSLYHDANDATLTSMRVTWASLSSGLLLRREIQVNDPRYRGWCRGAIDTYSRGFLLFPRTDIALIAAICSENRRREKAGELPKPIALVGWDHTAAMNLVACLFNGHGNAPNWFQLFRTDRDGAGQRIAEFLKNPVPNETATR